MPRTVADQHDDEATFNKAANAMAEMEEQVLQGGGIPDADETSPPVVDPPADEPPIDQPPVDEPPVTPPVEPPVTPPADEPPAPPVDQPPTGDQPPPVDEPDEFEQKLEADFQLGDKAHPNTKRLVKTLKESAKAEHRRAVEAERERKRVAAELETAKTLKLLTPEIETELEDHRSYRRITDYANTPEFQAKYGGAEKKLEEKVVRIVTADPNLAAGGRVMPQATLERLIAEAGGLLKFRTSQKLLPKEGWKAGGQTVGLHQDGSPMTQEEFWDAYVERTLTKRQQDLMREVVADATKLDLDRDADLRENAEGRGKKLEEIQQQRQAAHDAWVAEATQEGQEWVKANPDIGQKREVPANATAAEATEINAVNADIARAEGIVQQRMSEIRSGRLSGKATMRMVLNDAYALTRFPKIMEAKDKTISDLTAENKKLKQDINDIKNAGKTAHRGPTGGPATPVKAAPAKRQSPEDLMAEQQKEYTQPA